MSEEKLVSPQQTNELLQRILSAIEPQTRKRSLEIACAIILSLATFFGLINMPVCRE